VSSDFVAAVLLARCEFDAFDALAEERGPDSGYLLYLQRAARAEQAGDLEKAVALLPNPAMVGGAPLYLGQIHAGRARVLLNAGHEARARQEFARMREAMANNPTSRIVNGIPLHGAVFVSLDEALHALADEDFLNAVLASGDQGSEFDPNGRGRQRAWAALLLYHGRLEEAEAGFRHALAWSERERCPIEAGRCLRGLAEIAQRRGNVGEAMQLLDQAGELFRQHGARLYLDQVITTKLQLQGVSSTDIYTSIEAVTLAVERERPDMSVHAAPDGKVTLMFSDIEESTPLAERLGDAAWVVLLHEHDDIIRKQIAAHEGHEVKTIGDCFMVAFQSPAKALRCAVAIQSAFAAYNGEHAEQPLRVRIGLHTGEAVRDAGDFYGTNVVVASRIADQAKGGEILVSSTFRQLVDAEAEFGTVREVGLKGLSGLHHVQTVEWAENAV
jgi:class 3 adenylate cyclase